MAENKPRAQRKPFGASASVSASSRQRAHCQESGGQAEASRAGASRLMQACPSAFHVAAGDEAREAGHRESGGQAEASRAGASRLMRACPSAFHVAAGDEAREAGHRTMAGAGPQSPGQQGRGSQSVPRAAGNQPPRAPRAPRVVADPRAPSRRAHWALSTPGHLGVLGVLGGWNRIVRARPKQATAIPRSSIKFLMPQSSQAAHGPKIRYSAGTPRPPHTRRW